MSAPQPKPPILLHLGGIEDFVTVARMLRATGARRAEPGRRSNRTFVIDHDLTAQQAAALVDFIQYGTARGFLIVETNPPAYDDRGLDDWWANA